MKHLRVTYRLFFFALYTARIVLEVFWRRVLLGQDLRRVMAVRRRWAIRVLSGVGVRVTVEGAPPDHPCLLLANHRSYLDPIVLLRDAYAFPVAKAELASWPLIGKGAHWAGILYLKRNQNGSRISILKAIADIIREDGFSVILFPEGTTSGLPGMLPLNRGAFKAAAKWDLPVVPVALVFADPQDFWVGELSFLQHAWKRFREKEIRLRVMYGPVLRHTDSAWLEQETRHWIEAQLTAAQNTTTADV